MVTAITVIAGPGRSTASRTAFPGLEGSLSTSRVVCTSTIAVFDGGARLTAHFGHERVEVALGTTSNAALVAVTTRTAVIAPRLTDLAIRTIAGHMSSLTTDTTDDAGREVLLLWAIVFPVTDFTTVLAGLVLVVSKGTVECGKLSELVALQFVLTFGNRGSLL